jgi:hypothetical protein
MQQLVTHFSQDSFGNIVPWTTHLYPLVGIFLYLCYPTSLRIPAVMLHRISLLHNFLLMVFSGWTFLSLARILHRDGIGFGTVYYFKSFHQPTPFLTSFTGQTFDFVIYLFYLSKYYEFFDTFLLYLQGKQPIFLQKFHHIGAVIVWHLCYVYKVDAIWLSSFVNSFIHTIMYGYYLGCLLKIPAVRRIKQWITSLQLVQLCIPCFIAVWKYYPPAETPFNFGIIVFFVAYVAVLVYLFTEFYSMNYLYRDPRSKETSKTTSPSPSPSPDLESIKDLKTE